MLLSVGLPGVSCDHESTAAGGAPLAFAPPSTGDEARPKNGFSKGKRLAKRYCATCHMLPSPGHLDRNTWRRFVLPEMGMRLGMEPQNPEVKRRLKKEVASRAGVERVRDAGVFPGRKQLPEADWKRIRQYYLSNAPDELEPGRRRDIDVGVPLFRTIRAAEIKRPEVVYVEINTSRGRVLVGNAARKTLHVYKPNGKITEKFALASAPIDAELHRNYIDVLSAGQLNPNDGLDGKLQRVYLTGERETTTLLRDLPRPVHFTSGFINDDEGRDYVIAGFGQLLGRLTLYLNVDDRGYDRRIVLKEVPGALRSEIHDLDGDGRPDIIAQFGQGAEGVYLFRNQGDGTFTERKLVSFPPSYGSSHFELVDFNDDGHMDLITTNGDNGDYEPILKPYHGIRIFLNDGSNQFEQKHFFPMHGAYGVEAADFDRDGDRDLVAVSYFPDLRNHPEESIVYLENQGNGQFDPRTISAFDAGKWSTLDTGDIDRDGDVDIVIGNFTRITEAGRAPVSYKQRWKNQSLPPFLILENRLR